MDGLRPGDKTPPDHQGPGGSRQAGGEAGPRSALRAVKTKNKPEIWTLIKNQLHEEVPPEPRGLLTHHEQSAANDLAVFFYIYVYLGTHSRNVLCDENIQWVFFLCWMSDVKFALISGYDCGGITTGTRLHISSQSNCFKDF